MRAITSDERTLLAAQRLEIHTRAYIFPHDYVEVTPGVWSADVGGIEITQLEGFDWFHSIKWSVSLDTYIPSGTLTLRRRIGAYSLAPLIEASVLNRVPALDEDGDPITVYGPLVWPQRRIRIFTAITEPGVAPTGSPFPGDGNWGDWREVVTGLINKADWGKREDVVTIDFSGIESVLTSLIIKPNLDTNGNDIGWEYGSDGGTAVETVMQTILNDHAIGNLFGTGYLWVIQVPDSPAWFVNKFKVDSGTTIFDAIRNLALQIGWDLRFKYTLIDGTPAYLPFLYNPNRDSVVADTIIGPDEYDEVSSITVDDTMIRNDIDVSFTDPLTGIQVWRNFSDADSIAEFGRQYMHLGLPGTDNIDTVDEATTLGNSVLSDLKAPPIQQEISMMYFWPVEINDILEFPGNGDQYDTTKHLAVTAIDTTIEGRDGTSIIGTRGNPAAARSAWVVRASPIGPRIHASGVFWASPNPGGTADLSLRIEGSYDIFPIRADIFKDNPGGSVLVSHIFTEPGEIISASDTPEFDDVPIHSSRPPAYWARLTDALGGTTWEACIFAQAPDEHALEMTLKNFRVIDENDTTVTYGWTRGALLDKVRVTIHGPSADPAWPTTADAYTVQLSAGTDFYVVTKPTDPSEIVRGIAYGVLTDGVTFGPAEDIVVRPNISDSIPLLVFREVPGAFSSDVFIDVIDQFGSPGTLDLWTSHASTSTPDPTGAREGFLAIGSTPHTVGPTTSFSLTGGGSSTLLNDITKPTNKRKRIYARFTTDDGRSTGIRDYMLQDLQDILIDDFGQIKANQVLDWVQFSPNVRGIQAIYETLSDKDLAEAYTWRLGDTVYVNEDASFWRWDGGPHFVAGSGTSLVSAAVIQAGSIRTVHLSADFLTAQLAIINTAIIDSLLVGDLTIRGHLDGVDGTFSGSLSGATITGATGTFSGSLSGATITGATGTFSGSLSGATITGATGTFTGSLSGATITGATGTFSGAVSGVSGTFGTITAGVLSGAALTINLNLSGATDVVFGHPGLVLYGNGDAVFGGIIYAVGGSFVGALSGSDITGAVGTFSGALSAASGTFAGEVTGSTFSATTASFKNLDIGSAYLTLASTVTLGFTCAGDTGSIQFTDVGVFAPSGTYGSAFHISTILMADISGAINATSLYFGSQSVSKGASNSGGSGFAVLRVPN